MFCDFLNLFDNSQIVAYLFCVMHQTRRNLTASGPRPNPQGSYHYGMINTTRTIRLANSAQAINGKQRYAVNSVSFIPPDTPLKLADFFKISGVFSLGSISDSPTGGGAYHQTSVMAADFRGYVEIVFENSEDTVQSWHINGHSFFAVGQVYNIGYKFLTNWVVYEMLKFFIASCKTGVDIEIEISYYFCKYSTYLFYFSEDMIILRFAGWMEGSGHLQADYVTI